MERHSSQDLREKRFIQKKLNENFWQSIDVLHKHHIPIDRCFAINVKLIYEQLLKDC